MKRCTRSASSEVTSKGVGSLAADTLQSKQSSSTAKSLAASALAQRSGAKQTGKDMEELASKVLQSDKYAEATKQLAASVLSQSNKAR